ncbi:MAG: UDP-N-acetylmuramoyl-L-alanyl-D-glutamate--2,6-diaminopimelate ligase [Desulfovibrio sp.]|nr:UDP-N-acetylmuramoyl-L-alanyl-D-glutamate--2,6-diaminopimelate ligase [Desulfovibrio sp.]
MSRTYEQVVAMVREGTPVSADSRSVAPGGVFVAVKGATEDGTRYVPAALEAGARTVVAAEGAVDGALAARLAEAGCELVACPDTRLALSELACAQAGTDRLPLAVVAVTGTNGKTTCAYLLERLWQSLGRKVGVMGTVSYRWPGYCQPAPLTTPDPVSVHRNLAAMAKAGCEICVMEVSSHALDQKRVDHVPFAGACFTNLTQDHLDFHKDMETYFQAKRRLFAEVPKADKACALNADDPYGRRLAGLGGGLAVTYGFAGCPGGCDPGRHLHGDLLSQGTGGVRLRMSFDGESWELDSPLIGRFNADNLLTVQAMALAMGVKPAELQALASFTGVPGRLERVVNKKGLHVFVDYAHTPDALVNVLQALRGAGFRQIVTVFGCGGNRDRGKRPLMGEAVARLSDIAVLTSDNPRFEDPEAILQDVLPGLAKAPRTVVEVDRRKATELACSLVEPEGCLLIAGKGHEDYQIVQGVKHHYSDQEVVRELLGQA